MVTISKKVVIGMSGGVDSSVAASFLIDQGYDVIGVTMKVWDEQQEGGCCSLSAVEDARRVANLLGIPYYVMDFQKEFRDEVVDYFVKEYQQGKTPNPCIACNKFIKFDWLLKKAEAMGAHYIATGHYANVEHKNGRYLLKGAADQHKDQTYVLYNLNQEQLSRALFPLSDISKEQTREYAEKLGMVVANKPDSQEICFVTDNDYAGFIQNYTGMKPKKGKFIDRNGNILGEHQGIIHYTVGQRKGLGIAFGKPMFVTGIDAKTNSVILGEGEDVFCDTLYAKDANFIPFDTLEGEIKAEAKVRYSAKKAPCKIIPAVDGVKVIFDTPQRAITPGQAVVFYDGDYVLGGGTIDGQHE